MTISTRAWQLLGVGVRWQFALPVAFCLCHEKHDAAYVCVGLCTDSGAAEHTKGGCGLGKSGSQEAAWSAGLRVIGTDGRDDGDIAPQLPVKELRPCAVEIVGATLNYPIGPYVRGSLKSSLMGLLGHRERTVAPKFVEAIRNLTISFAQGERVALIGRNGSGKSTLLRALAGIYPIEKGSIRVIGQIGTLLDIGVGFEMESTGRENIYYRGMAMGFSKSALRKFEPDIVSFADLGEFIDLPMRTYSAGMQVRLGFGVSTQISPDVLLIDEVFGAGDAQFAHKAYQRIMNVVQRSGIMVLATHDLGLVETLCTRAIWLDQGLVVRDGHPSIILPQFSRYMAGEMTI